MRLTGVGAAPGIAVGPVWRHRQMEGGEPLPDVRAAADLASGELVGLADRVRAMGRHDEAAIFDAQALMAVDPLIVEEAETRARAIDARDPDTLAAAVEAVSRAAAETLANLPDEVIAARAADIRDVGARIARIVSGRRLILPDRPSIAVADDLPPSVTAEIPPGLLLGMALEQGSATSHAAILARGLEIPAVVGVRGLLDAIAALAPGDAELTVAIDGDGEVVLAPTGAELAALDERRRAHDRAAQHARTLRGHAGRTADGQPVRLIANIGRPEEADRALEAGAEGVGLFRTEFLFVGRSDAPTEDEQTDAYASVLRAFGRDRPVVIRLADIGGDKPIPYLHLDPEANPFLGVRGLRLAYADRELYLCQLRAVARAGAIAGSIPQVMAPMVATAEDVTLLRDLVDAALADLDARGIPRAPRIIAGIMVEVPSAALLAPVLAADVDFFSIGSNDLTQYTLAMDRTSPALAASADALHPAVLRMIRATVEGADAAGIHVAVCGELAGDPAGALVLVGLGVDELSMDAGSLDAVRFALRGATTAELGSLAGAALVAGTSGEVRALAEGAVTSARARSEAELASPAVSPVGAD